MMADPAPGSAWRAYGSLLFVDLIIWLFLWTALLNSQGALLITPRWLWAFRAFSWVLLHTVSSATLEKNIYNPLKPWLALLCFVPPVYDMVQTLVLRGRCGFSPVPVPLMVVLSAVTATLIHLMWDKAFPSKKVENEQEARLLLMRVLRYSKPDYLHLGAAFFFLILGALFESRIPYYTGKIVDGLRGEYQHGAFLWAIACMSFHSFGSSLFNGLRGGMFMCSLSRLNKRIRHMLFRNLLRQDISFFEENIPGSLTSRLVSDTDKMGHSISLNVNVLLRSLVKTCCMLMQMLSLSWQLTLLNCVEMPLFAVLQNYYNIHYQKTSRELLECMAEAEKLASSTINSVKTLRSFGAEAQELKRYKEALDRKLQILNRKGIFSAFHRLLRRCVALGLRVTMLLLGYRLISLGQLSSGSLLAFVLYQNDMSANMKELVYSYGDILNKVWSAEKVFELLDRIPSMQEAGDWVPENLEGRITFDNVTLSYPSRPNSKALKSVSIELRPGKMTALVGPSNGGKSSCVSLLQRFYEPQQGQVLLDNTLLTKYQHQYLCSQIAAVSQNPVLFSGSVKYNIAYGLHDCSIEKVKEAAEKANAHYFISKLDKGYDTDVGESGKLLSTGQKQRIAIARVLIRNPKILILDEVISKSDKETQNVVQEVLSHSIGQTVLVVAHHLQTIERADNIVYMEDGKVIEQGTHEQLMAERGRYFYLRAQLFKMDSEKDQAN